MIKNDIRKANLKLRFLSIYDEDDTEKILEKENNLKIELKKHRDRLSDVDLNKLMLMFWKIVNHKYASIIKLEIGKALNKFT